MRQITKAGYSECVGIKQQREWTTKQKKGDTNIKPTFINVHDLSLLRNKEVKNDIEYKEDRT